MEKSTKGEEWRNGGKEGRRIVEKKG